MSAQSTKRRAGAFSGWDLLIVLVTVALLLFFSPVFLRRPCSNVRIHCINNVKQIGLGFRMWANDHSEKFPMTDSATNEGTLEFVGTGEVFRHYLAISNELNTPKVLTCRSDTDRQRVATFAGLNDGNLSYFVGVDARETDPRTILCGDRNISTNGRLMAGILTLTSNSRVAWT